MRTYKSALLLVVSLLVACSTEPVDTGSANAVAATNPLERVTIYRDAYGTPHVVADSNRGVYYGYGYAVATDRLFQMEMLRRTTQGRVAEVLGQAYLALDIKLRTSYDHRSVHEQLASLAPAEREILEAYAAGFSARINDVLANRESLLPGEFTEYGFLPQPWEAYDVAMAFVGSIAHRYSDFNSERDNLELLRSLEGRHGKDVAWSIFNASKWLWDAESPVTVPREGKQIEPPSPGRPAYLDSLLGDPAVSRLTLDNGGRFAGLTSDPRIAARQRQTLARDGFTGSPGFTGASNYWAMRNLQDAAAALVNGPQFGFASPGYVYGIGLHGGDFNAVGNTLLALPSLLFAHNNHIAWGSTAGISDQCDEFMLVLNPENPQQYLHRGAWHDFESWEEVIAVKDSKPVTVTVRRSAQGMVQAWLPEESVAWTRAWGWDGSEVASLLAWVMLATDRNLDDAHQRIGNMGTNINMYTMDRQGNISYVHAGRYPRRVVGHDPRLPAPGDGTFDWRGSRPYSDNPSVRNPAQNYIANWNNRPRADWISTDLWSYTWGRADRARIIFDALESRQGGSVADIDSVNREISFADVNAPFLLPYLFAAWEEVEATGPEAEALRRMQTWDRTWKVDDRGNYGPANALMESWVRHLLVAAIRDDVGEEMFHLYAATNYPNAALGPSIPNPPGVKVLVRNLDALVAGVDVEYDFFNGADARQVIRQAFSAAVNELVQAQGGQPGAWTLAAHPMQWKPYNFRGVPQASESAVHELPGYLHRGSENNLFVATGDGIEARDVLPPGQSAFVSVGGEASPHRSDQMSLYADFNYKPVPFSLEEVKAAAVSKTSLQIPR